MRKKLLLFVLILISLHGNIYAGFAMKDNKVTSSLLVEEKLIVLNNPVKDGMLRIKYQITEGLPFNLTIVNSLGEQVFTAKRNASRQEISFDISKLSTGIYFLRVNSEDGSITKKLIVQ